jgi:hypothetical protein
MKEKPIMAGPRSMAREKNLDSVAPATEAALRRERRAKRNDYQLLWRLSKKTEERHRLTRQLIYLVNDVASAIADMCDVGTAVKVNGVGALKVELWTSYIESKKVLIFCDSKNEGDDRGEGDYALPGAAFGFHVEPASRFFFNGDLSAQGRAASRDNYLSFARKIPEIVNAFAAEEDVIIKRLLSAFASLRHMVGST